MGCDIHMVLEKRWNDRWVGTWDFRSVEGHAVITGESGERITGNGYVRADARNRNYDLFAALASVRGSGPHGPRGVPDDVSDLADMEIDRWGEDGHSHSWMLLSEALPIFQRIQFKHVQAQLEGKSKQDLFREAMHDLGIDNIPDELWNAGPEALTGYRLVFWFDN